MNFKRWWALSACLALSFMLISLALPVRASANSFYDDDGFFVLQSNNFPSDYPYYDIYSSPVVDSSVSIPSGYHLIGYNADVGYSSLSYPTTVEWYYANTSSDITGYFTGYTLTVESSIGNLFYIRNRCSSSGVLTFNRASYSSGLSSGRLNKFTFFVPVYDQNGNLHLPEGQVNFTLNTAIIGYNLVINSQINSGDATSVDYYIFPSSAPISGGVSSTIVSPTPASELSVAQKQTFIQKFGSAFNTLIGDITDLITSITSPSVSLSSSSSSRSSGFFNPSSFGLTYEKIGSGRLYPLTGGGGITPTANLSLKDMVSSHTGVYVNSALKLVAVVNTSNTSFIATFDFNPSQIVGGSPVPPSIIQGPVTPPNPSLNDPDLQDLADYLKNLGNTFNENQIRNDENLIAMLGAMPWSNFIGTGFAGGFANALPNLSFTLDHLFDSLFDKYTAPTEEQINEILADIETERTSLRAKLAFVDDVKTEYYFVISTITADNNSVPPDFEFVLPSMWSGGETIRCKLVTYEIATPYIMSIIKSILTVFLSLALLLHIWRTLPATIGNMPRGDD